VKHCAAGLAHSSLLRQTGRLKSLARGLPCVNKVRTSRAQCDYTDASTTRSTAPLERPDQPQLPQRALARSVSLTATDAHAVSRQFGYHLVGVVWSHDRLHHRADLARRPER
jgi:hypothetical protein